MSIENGVPHFYGHEAESVRLCQLLLARLKFPTAVIKRVTHLVGQHMFSYTPDWTDAAVRRFIIRVGRENLSDIFTLRRADSYGMTGVLPDSRSLADLRGRIAEIFAKEEALSLKSLAVCGEDIMKILGLPPGPCIGSILNFLLEAVVEDPAMNTREKLLLMAENFYKTRLDTSKPQGR